MVDEKDIDDLLKKARTLLSQRRLDDAQSTVEIALSMLTEQDIEKLVSAHLILGTVIVVGRHAAFPLRRKPSAVSNRADESGIQRH